MRGKSREVSLELCVEDRSTDILIPIIKEFALPGTTIISDCWKASRFSSEEYIHQTKQRTGACTNTIEST